MEKRLLLAIGLSLLVLLSWSALASKTQPIDNKRVTLVAPDQARPIEPKPSPANSSLPFAEPKQPLLEINRENNVLFFDEERAVINKVVFKTNHRENSFPLYFAFLSDDGNVKYSRISNSPEEITFSGQDNSKKIIKNFRFSKSNYTIELEIKIQNITNSPITLSLPLALGKLDLSRNNDQLRYEDVYLVGPDKSLHLPVTKEYHSEKVKVLGIRDRYFCLIVEPEKDSFKAAIRKLDNSATEVTLSSESIVLQPGAQIGHLFHVYLGPQDLKMINKINPTWAGIIYFGTFDFIAQVLLQTLEFLYNIFHNWGLAIVILSILVYLLLYPLSLKQMRSMKEMQAIQPKVEELRKLYKDNPQKMNKEIMELYKLHKVNPFGGCLPLLLQMPIFFALYNALMRSVALRGAKFLWIKDLSEPDQLFNLPVSLPVVGNEFNILPIVMALIMFYQQKMSSAASSGASAEQQRIMLIIMPVMFGLIFYRMPSGLVLYWLINSMLMFIFQLRMNRAK